MNKSFLFEFIDTDKLENNVSDILSNMDIIFENSKYTIYKPTSNKQLGELARTYLWDYKSDYQDILLMATKENVPEIDLIDVVRKEYYPSMETDSAEYCDWLTPTDDLIEFFNNQLHFNSVEEFIGFWGSNFSDNKTLLNDFYDLFEKTETEPIHIPFEETDLEDCMDFAVDNNIRDNYLIEAILGGFVDDLEYYIDEWDGPDWEDDLSDMDIDNINAENLKLIGAKSTKELIEYKNKIYDYAYTDEEFYDLLSYIFTVVDNATQEVLGKEFIKDAVNEFWRIIKQAAKDFKVSRYFISENNELVFEYNSIRDIPLETLDYVLHAPLKVLTEDFYGHLVGDMRANIINYIDENLTDATYYSGPMSYDIDKYNEILKYKLEGLVDRGVFLNDPNRVEFEID